MKLSIAIDAYLAYRRNGWSESTVKNDTKVLKKLIAHLGDINIKTITPEVMDEFLRSKPMNPNSPGTYNLYFSALRNFFKWARQRKHVPIDFDPLVGQRVKPKPETPKLRIPLEQFPALLNAATNSRDRMAVAIGIYLMTRESEARSIRLGDINLNEGWIGVHVHKSGKYDQMPISPELDAELRRYLIAYAQQHGELQDDWYLLPKMKLTNRWQEYEMCPTRGLGPGGLSRPIQRILGKMGYPTTKAGMHTLRRSAAAAVFMEKKRLGYDGALRQVASWLHHKSQYQSEVYIGIDVDRSERDKQARSGPLYPSLQADNVTYLGEGHGRNTDKAV